MIRINYDNGQSGSQGAATQNVGLGTLGNQVFTGTPLPKENYAAADYAGNKAAAKGVEQQAAQTNIDAAKMKGAAEISTIQSNGQLVQSINDTVQRTTNSIIDDLEKQRGFAIQEDSNTIANTKKQLGEISDQVKIDADNQYASGKLTQSQLPNWIKDETAKRHQKLISDTKLNIDAHREMLNIHSSADITEKFKLNNEEFIKSVQKDTEARYSNELSEVVKGGASLATRDAANQQLEALVNNPAFINAAGGPNLAIAAVSKVRASIDTKILKTALDDPAKAEEALAHGDYDQLFETLGVDARASFESDLKTAKLQETSRAEAETNKAAETEFQNLNMRFNDYDADPIKNKLPTEMEIKDNPNLTIEYKNRSLAMLNDRRHAAQVKYEKDHEVEQKYNTFGAASLNDSERNDLFVKTRLPALNERPETLVQVTNDSINQGLGVPDSLARVWDNKPNKDNEKAWAEGVVNITSTKPEDSKKISEGTRDIASIMVNEGITYDEAKQRLTENKSKSLDKSNLENSLLKNEKFFKYNDDGKSAIGSITGLPSDAVTPDMHREIIKKSNEIYNRVGGNPEEAVKRAVAELRIGVTSAGGQEQLLRNNPEQFIRNSDQMELFKSDIDSIKKKNHLDAVLLREEGKDSKGNPRYELARPDGIKLIDPKTHKPYSITADQDEYARRLVEKDAVGITPPRDVISALQGKHRQNYQVISNVLISHGVTPEAVHGILGNVSQESGGNPFVENTEKGSHYGLYQLSDAHQKKYEKMFGHTAKSVRDREQAIKEQTEYVLSQIEGTSLGNKIKTSRNRHEVSDAWVNDFEIPANPGSAAMVAEQTKRRKLSDKFTNVGKA